MKKRMITSALLLALLAPAIAPADTLVAILEPVSIYIPNEFDLGGTVSGITDVTMRHPPRR